MKKRVVFIVGLLLLGCNWSISAQGYTYDSSEMWYGYPSNIVRPARDIEAARTAVAKIVPFIRGSTIYAEDKSYYDDYFIPLLTDWLSIDINLRKDLSSEELNSTLFESFDFFIDIHEAYVSGEWRYDRRWGRVPFVYEDLNNTSEFDRAINPFVLTSYIVNINPEWNIEFLGNTGGFRTVGLFKLLMNPHSPYQELLDPYHNTIEFYKRFLTAFNDRKLTNREDILWRAFLGGTAGGFFDLFGQGSLTPEGRSMMWMIYKRAEILMVLYGISVGEAP